MNAAGHPIQAPDQSLADHRGDMAAWLGCDLAALDSDHDPLHANLCQWAGAPSYSLMIAQGIDLPEAKRRLADLEEYAVLGVQRWLNHLAAEGEGSHA